VSGAGDHTHLLTSCYQDSRHRAGARDRSEAHHCYRRGQQGNYISVSEAALGSAKWKRGLILRHFSVMAVCLVLPVTNFKKVIRCLLILLLLQSQCGLLQ